MLYTKVLIYTRINMPMWFLPRGMHKWKFVISSLQSEKDYILNDDSQRTQGPTG